MVFKFPIVFSKLPDSVVEVACDFFRKSMISLSESMVVLDKSIAVCLRL